MKSGPARRDGGVTGAGIIGSICGDDAEGLVVRDLIQQVGPHGRIADPTAGDLDGKDFQGIHSDPEVNLAPVPWPGRPMFYGQPLSHCISGSNQTNSEPRLTSAFAIGLEPNGASMAHCRQARSWCGRRGTSVCSCATAITLNPQSEPSIALAQQSRAALNPCAGHDVLQGPVDAIGKLDCFNPGVGVLARAVLISSRDFFGRNRTGCDVKSTKAKLTYSGTSGVDLLITILPTGEVIRIDKRYHNLSFGYGIERISFSDGVVWSLEDILSEARMEGGASNDLLIGTAHGDNIFGGLTKAFSPSGCDRIVPLFSSVMRARLRNGSGTRRPESRLSLPVFSGPVAFEISEKWFQSHESIMILDICNLHLDLSGT